MTHIYENIFLPFCMHVVSKLWQVFELHHVVCKVLFVLHIVYICVLHILEQGMQENKLVYLSFWSPCFIFCQCHQFAEENHSFHHPHLKSPVWIFFLCISLKMYSLCIIILLFSNVNARLSSNSSFILPHLVLPQLCSLQNWCLQYL